MPAKITRSAARLLLSNRLRSLLSAGKRMLKPPLTKIELVANPDITFRQDTESAPFPLASNQAFPLIFICHFVLRTHQSLLKLNQTERPELQWMDWQLMPNRFPGGIMGPTASLFHTIMSGVSHQRLVAGNIRLLTLVDNSADAGSILADNIAGLLSEKLKNRNFDGARRRASAQGRTIDLLEAWRKSRLSFSLRLDSKVQAPTNFVWANLPTNPFDV
jgi:hypothetical protein